MEFLKLMIYSTKFKVKAKDNLRACKDLTRNLISIFQTRPEIKVKSLIHLKIHLIAGKTKKMKDQVTKNLQDAREDIKTQVKTKARTNNLSKKNNTNQPTKKMINLKKSLKNGQKNKRFKQKLLRKKLSSNLAKMIYHRFHIKEEGRKPNKIQRTTILI